MPRLIDSHVHLQDSRLFNRSDFQSRLKSASAAGVAGWICNGTAPTDWREVRALSTKFVEIHPSFGLHPWKIPQLSEASVESALVELDTLLEHTPSAGVGEIGLDKWIKAPEIQRQKAAFRAQLALAERYQRAVTIHCLQAWGHLLEILSETPPTVPFLIHSFAGPEEMLADLVELGAYFSLSPYFFHKRKRAQLELFNKTPLSRRLLETDAPDMAPPVGWGSPHLIDSASGAALHGPETLPFLFDHAHKAWNLSPEYTEQLLLENFRTWWSHDTAAAPR